MAKRITSYKELRVYNNAIELAMEIFELSKKFPSDERYSLTNQMRRSSRSVCTNIAEAWRKRRYKAAFIAKLSDSETEACETPVWSDIAFRCNYITKEQMQNYDARYDEVMAQIVSMISGADNWLIKPNT